MDKDKVDIRGRAGDALVKNARRLIDQRQQQCLHHRIICQRLAGDAMARRLGGDQRGHIGIQADRFAILIYIPATAGLATKPASLADLILNLAVTPLGVARRLLPPPVRPGDIEP